MKSAGIFVTLLLPVTLLLALGQAINGRVQAKPQLVDVGGIIATDTTWTAANSPYILTDRVTVQTGVTLTIEAGVIVQTPDTGDYLDVQGHLEAVGTAVNPILFTSIDDLPTNNWSGIAVSGSANFEFATMRHAYTALFVSGSSGGVVSLANSTVEENLTHPIVVNADALHRLAMNNVTFSNNVPNRVGIETSGGNLTLAGSLSLSPQPGLEGYEELNTDIPTVFSVPDGITLTLQPGTNLMMLSTVQIAGHIAANGTVAEPITWQAVPESDGGVFGVVVLPTGTAVLTHTTLKDSPGFGIAVVGESDAPVLLENSTLEGIGYYPMIIEPPSLHRVQMNNVTFLNNAVNRVLVDNEAGKSIAADVTLKPQPGLEWYEVTDFSQTWPPEFTVPQGITLTLEPGVEMRFGDGVETMVVNGRLQANGTELDPVIFDESFSSSGYYLYFSETGSASLLNTTIKNATNAAMAVAGQSNQLVTLQNVLLQSTNGYPIVVEAPALHRLQMNNVTFLNNAANRVMVDTRAGALAADVTLSPQPGLEWYEITDFVQTWPLEFTVPEGITLTIEPGVEMRFGVGAETMVVDGRLQAIGTPTSPITFTSAADSAPGEWEGIVLQGDSSQLENVVVRNGRENLLIGSLNPTAAVEINNSVISHSSETPLGIQTDHLHQASLSNVSFVNNVEGDNIVLYGANTLGGDAILTDQPGLDAYIVLGLLQPNSPGIVVPDDITLTMEPGVELRFRETAMTMVVDGRLQAIGTPTSPITFTSVADSAPGEWEGIVLQGDSSQLENVVVRNGRESLLIGSLNPTATVQISDSVFSHSSLNPIAIQANNLHQVSLSNVTFANNVEGNNIVVFKSLVLGGTPLDELALAGDVVLTDQPGLDAYVVLHGGVATDWFVIPPTHTLTINPGVTMKFNGIGNRLGLRVEGALHTVGTDAEPVTFTSYADSAPDQWEGIVVENGDVQLDHTEVRYGRYNLTVNNTAVSTPVVLQNSQLHDAAMDGLLVFDGVVTAVCSRFTSNSGSGVFVLDTGNPDVQISSSALVGNVDAGLVNQNTILVDARQNWWGDASGPAGIGSGSGDAVLGNALFDPWLPEDACTTVTYQLYLPMVINP